MAIMSGGQLVLSDAFSPWTYRSNYLAPGGFGLSGDTFATYGELYSKQNLVATLVNKRALATARLPLKVYERTPTGRIDARDNPYAVLLRTPNRRQDPFALWDWTSHTIDVYGEAMWLKVRGRDGLPAEVWPIHPSNIRIDRDPDSDQLIYSYGPGVLAGTDPLYIIPERDIVHFKTYNPLTTVRGMSPLEPLRQTLVNEDAARRATTAFWNNGARPAMYLSHPTTMSKPAMDRLKASWDAIHGGADNFGKTAILEEGMAPHTISLSAEEAQYIQTRKLNQTEVCMAYDVPPPVVHILDHATFSNITEQMRSMYRDTMAPHLGRLEATLDYQLRPDFDDAGDIYAEFLMDEVLRGAFEQRAQSYQQAVNSGWLMPSEVRKLENLPPVEAADRLFVNATLIPIDEASQRTSANIPAKTPGQTPGELAAAQSPEDEAGVQLPSDKSLSSTQIRTLMGRLSRTATIDDVDIKSLIDGFDTFTPAALVTLAFGQALDAGDGLDGFKSRLRALKGSDR